MPRIRELVFSCALAAALPICSTASVTVFTDRGSWNAAVQAAGYSLAGVSFSQPTAWSASDYSVGTESYLGLTSNQTTNGMSVTIASAQFEGLAPTVSIQNNSLVDSEQSSQPERDTSFSFGKTVYAFGGDYTANCTGFGCASSTFFLSPANSFGIVNGANSTGFWGIVETPDLGTQQFVQGINSCASGDPCYFNYALSNLDVAVATPEPNYRGLLTLFGLSALLWGTRRARTRVDQPGSRA